MGPRVHHASTHPSMQCMHACKRRPSIYSGIQKALQDLGSNVRACNTHPGQLSWPMLSSRLKQLKDQSIAVRNGLQGYSAFTSSDPCACELLTTHRDCAVQVAALIKRMMAEPVDPPVRDLMWELTVSTGMALSYWPRQWPNNHMGSRQLLDLVGAMLHNVKQPSESITNDSPSFLTMVVEAVVWISTSIMLRAQPALSPTLVNRLCCVAVNAIGPHVRTSSSTFNPWILANPARVIASQLLEVLQRLDFVSYSSAAFYEFSGLLVMLASGPDSVQQAYRYTAAHYHHADAVATSMDKYIPQLTTPADQLLRAWVRCGLLFPELAMQSVVTVKNIYHTLASMHPDTRTHKMQRDILRLCFTVTRRCCLDHEVLAADDHTMFCCSDLLWLVLQGDAVDSNLAVQSRSSGQLRSKHIILLAEAIGRGGVVQPAQPILHNVVGVAHCIEVSCITLAASTWHLGSDPEHTKALQSLLGTTHKQVCHIIELTAQSKNRSLFPSIVRSCAILQRFVARFEALGISNTPLYRLAAIACLCAQELSMCFKLPLATFPETLRIPGPSVLAWHAFTMRFHGRLLPGCGNMSCQVMTGHCEAYLPTLLCSGCMRVRYCCVDCQRQAWIEGQHKVLCPRWQRLASS